LPLCLLAVQLQLIKFKKSQVSKLFILNRIPILIKVISAIFCCKTYVRISKFNDKTEVRVKRLSLSH